MSQPVLEVEDLTVQYESNDETITAVSNASFTIQEGEYFGLIGESGCGKSTIAKAIIGGLDQNGRVASGSIRYRGNEIQDLTERELNEEIRWKEISWIPQGSMNSLEPLQRVSEQAIEIGRTHTEMSTDEILERFRETFDVVGLPEERIDDYPHQFSGGMQQRALIALALFLRPSVVIADEPTTALDVITQDQIFKYFDRIKEDLGTSMMLITHDISVVFESCQRMAIMHSGQVAERGQATQLYDAPRHPYSILLQRAFPDFRDQGRELEIIDGYPPQMTGEVDYCTFADRCPWAVDECRTRAPELESIDGDAGADEHLTACIRKEETPQLAAGSRQDGGE